MKLIKYELEKIFTIKSVAILIIITGLMFLRFVVPHAGVSGNRELVKDTAAQMVKNYGNTMEEDEFLDFKEKYNKKVAKAEKIIKDNKEFADLGVINYEEFFKITRNNGEEKYQSQEIQDLSYKYTYHDEISIFRELWEIENILICYDYTLFNNEDPYHGSSINENKSTWVKSVPRMKEIISSGDIKSLLPYKVFEEYDAQIKSVTTIILVSIVLMISPIYLKDKITKLNYIQYSSKIGRSLFKKKIIASLLASILIITLQLLVFFIYYSKQGTSVFFGCNISGYYNTPVKSWYDLTFKNYIGVTILCVYAVDIIMSLISIYISSKVNTYISLLGIQVVNLFIFNNLLLKLLVNYVTSMYININRLWTVYLPKYTFEIVYLLLIIIVSTIMYIRNKREQKIEIN